MRSHLSADISCLSPFFERAAAFGFRVGPGEAPTVSPMLDPGGPVALRVIVSLRPGPGPGRVFADFLKASLEVR